ncbi:MAG TPA: hypothetical protein VHE83_08220 [Mycobacteriales bacterium]|nr:hypothetical protein [Mycobacteriales bacterium]
MPDWTALRDELVADVRAPNFDVVLIQARRIRRRRFAAAAGVVATAVVVPVAIAVPLVRDGASAPTGPPPTPSPVVDAGAGPWGSTTWTDPDHGWALAMQCSNKPGCYPTLARTSDGGRTWSLVAVPRELAWKDNGPLFVDGSRLWLGLTTSADDGQHWSELGGFPGGTGSAVRPMAAGLTPKAIVVTGAGACRAALTLRSYKPTGPTGQRVATVRSAEGDAGPIVDAVEGVDGSVAFTVGHSYPDACGAPAPQTTYVITGAGLVSSGVVPDLTLIGYYNLVQMWFRGPTGDIYSSGDAGRTRTRLPIHGVSQVLPFDSQRLLLTRTDDHGFHLYLSTDGGQTAHIVLTEPNVEASGSIAMVSATRAVLTTPDGHVRRTDDAGATWQDVGHLPALPPL